jgi:enoyl-CoA hydratase/carnithine racemase
MSELTLAIDDKIAVLTIANPPQNRLGTTFLEEFTEAVELVAKSGVRAAIIQGQGENFSYGGDIRAWPNLSPIELRALFDRWLTVFNRFERLPIPTIAAVKGLCYGGRFEIALRCDLIVAGQSATFAHPEQSLGITTLMGGVYRLAERAGRSFAAKLAYTSDPVGASEMLARGVVTEIVPDADVEASARDLAIRLANGPTRAHAAHKTLLRLWAQGGVQAADEAIIDISLPLYETQDVRNGLASAIDALNRGVKRPTLTFEGR